MQNQDNNELITKFNISLETPPVDAAQLKDS